MRDQRSSTQVLAGVFICAIVLAACTLVACTPTPMLSSAETAGPPTATMAVEPSPTPAPTEEAVTPSPEPTDTAETTAPSDTPAPEEPTASSQPTPTEEPSPTPKPSPEPPTAQGEAILEEACSVCHTLARVQASRKSRDAWAETIDTMVGFGAVLSDSEREVLIDYLVTEYGP